MAAEAPWRRKSVASAGILAVFLLQGCENGMKDMYAQDKYAPLAASQNWPDGRSARPLPAGTVPYSTGVGAETSSGERGEIIRLTVDHADYRPASLLRGRERYDIYCASCHGASGDGNGYIVARGFPKPPSYHSDRLRATADSYLYDVISRGHGVMYGFADRIDAGDRWAIVGYVRALQLSQNARLEDVPPAEQAELKEAAP
jgi:mono/diheme cytochrome c family protein